MFSRNDVRSNGTAHPVREEICGVCALNKQCAIPSIDSVYFLQMHYSYLLLFDQAF